MDSTSALSSVFITLGLNPETSTVFSRCSVTGFSPSVMKTLLKADVESITPVAQMMATLMQERYNF